MLGKSVGSYLITSKLGEGGMGAVYLAEHAVLGRRAAIKLLLPELSVNQSIVNRFLTEARAVAAISHPGIVQVFDYGVHETGCAYIVMELLEGESLETRLRRMQQMPALDVVRLGRQIALSLAAAH